MSQQLPQPHWLTQLQDQHDIPKTVNPLSTRPHQNVVWCNNSWLGFLKFLTYVPKEREKITEKYEPSRLKITILGANRQLFRLEKIAKCSYFILSTQNIKFYLFVMKIKKFLLPIWWYNRGLCPFGNKYFGVFVLNGLSNAVVTRSHKAVLWGLSGFIWVNS